MECHDTKDAGLQKAHQDQPFATANCLQCHNPHESAKPKLLQTFLHVPFESKMCESCHLPSADGKVVLTNKDSRALCLTCHEEQGKKIEAAKVHHPGAQGDCVACHNPHGRKSPGFLQPDPVKACLTCHADQVNGVPCQSPMQFNSGLANRSFLFQQIRQFGGTCSAGQSGKCSAWAQGCPGG